VRIDYFGVDASGRLAYNSMDAGGAYYITPEPSGILLVTMSFSILAAWRWQRRRRHAE